jgi:hypothetical protein
MWAMSVNERVAFYLAQDACLQLQPGISGLKYFSSTVEAGLTLHINGSMRTHRGLDVHGKR